MKTDEERCREYGVPYDPTITRKLVYEQSRWKCHICGKAVNQRRKYPHPKSPSLDHITPLSWRQNSPGHVWSNVALAHLVCNQRKGARYAGGTVPVRLRRPGRFSLSDATKWKMILFGFVFLLWVGGASTTVLTIGVLLCILTVIPRGKPRRRRRAWWKL